MDLSRVILGSVVTEKSERLKTERSYTLRVSPAATKIDVMNALKEFYDVEPTSVRVMRTPGKTRLVGRGKLFTKRHSTKKMIVTLASDSKALDLTHFAS
jgi:ribosomal protein L23